MPGNFSVPATSHCEVYVEGDVGRWGSGIVFHSKSHHRKTDNPTSPLLKPRLQHTAEWHLFSASLSSLLDLHLPRFSISATYNLEEILPLIGLGNMFGMEADLSGIMGQLNKTVSRVRWGMWTWGGGMFLSHTKCIGKPRSSVFFLD